MFAVVLVGLVALMVTLTVMAFTALGVVQGIVLAVLSALTIGAVLFIAKS